MPPAAQRCGQTSWGIHAIQVVNEHVAFMSIYNANYRLVYRTFALHSGIVPQILQKHNPEYVLIWSDLRLCMLGSGTTLVVQVRPTGEP